MSDRGWRLELGDCLSVLPSFQSNSIDSVVTDPPYGLEFMGKEWDHGVPGIRFWVASLRVLKPGGHLLAFGGTRTYHRLACAIEDAGFEIRDSIHWIYGTGFPKSLDVSKAMDAVAPRVGMFEAFAAHFSEQRKASGKTQKEIAQHFPSKTGGLTGCVWNWENGANVPTREQWLILRPMLGLSAAWLPLIERAEEEREVVGESDQGAGDTSWFITPGDFNITTPATPLAKKWDGWGTALKPAHEPVVVARKPLEGTVAANVEKWGTGGINVDGCRVQVDPRDKKSEGWRHGRQANKNLGGFSTSSGDIVDGKGRWPPNVVLSPEAAKEMDCQSGELTSGSRKPGVRNGMGFHGADGDGGPEITGSAGGASRFFPIFRYEPKTSRNERDAGLETLTHRTGGELTGRKDDSAGTQSPRAGSGRLGGGRNVHPTVKPVALMQWLCRLVTPPGGAVLDPFAGSGSTGIAALREGFEFVGIEIDPEYHKIACLRLEEDAPLFNRR